jgi:hypothetical protein
MLRAVGAQQIIALSANPESIEDFLDEESNELDLEKSWHGLHYLLTGSAWEGAEPLCYLASGGEEIGEDLGYGPARALSPAQVAAWSNALSAITTTELQRRFDPQAFDQAQIYPLVWDEGDEAFEWLNENFEALRDFLAQAKSANHGAIVYLT